MKRTSLLVVLLVALTVGALGGMSTPAGAQFYQVYGYTYPAPPPNPYASPWVGQNTPWTFYQGDWFLNGILQYFFGPQYGWAPYYAYPTVYIVRPANWYAPKWNVWYQRNPHYWKTFTAKYPYWRGHHPGQHYDQAFYNAHHRGQGGGWNQGFHGVRAPGAVGPGPRGPVAPAPGVRPHGAPGPAVHAPVAPAPGVRPHGTPGPAVHAPVAAGPGGHERKGPGPAVRGPGTPGPAAHTPAATAPGQRGPAPAGPGTHKSDKTHPGEKRHQE
jgi:hypothetical protein